MKGTARKGKRSVVAGSSHFEDGPRTGLVRRGRIGRTLILLLLLLLLLLLVGRAFAIHVVRCRGGAWRCGSRCRCSSFLGCYNCSHAPGPPQLRVGRPAPKHAELRRWNRVRWNWSTACVAVSVCWTGPSFTRGSATGTRGWNATPPGDKTRKLSGFCACQPPR